MLREPTRRSGAAVTLAAIEVPLEDATRFGVIQVDADDRIVGFQEKPSEPDPRARGATDHGADLDGHLRLRGRRAGAGARARTRPRPPATTSARTSSRLLARFRRADVRPPLPRREQEGGEVLARHRHPRRLLRGESRPLRRQPRVQPLRPGVAAAHAPAAGATRQVRVRRGGPALRAGAGLDHLGRVHRLGQPRGGQRAVPERARPQLLPRSRTASSCRASASGATRGCGA